MVSALGAAAGVTIENARLYESSRRQQDWLRASGEVTTRLLSGSDSDQVLAALAAQALELSGADLAMVALPDGDSGRLVIEHADGDGAAAVRGLVLPAGQSLSGMVLETGQAQQVVDAMDEAVRDIRIAIFSLHSRGQGTLPGLRAQAVAVADEMIPLLGFARTLRMTGGLDQQVTAGQAEQLLAVLREALSNAARHAQASRVEVDIEASSDLVLRVADDRTGIAPGGRRSGLASPGGD